MKTMLALVLALVAVGRAHAFFDMDFFKHFNQGFERMNERHREHAHHLQHTLRTALSDLPRDVEPLEPLEPLDADVEYLEPAEDETSGTPFFGGGGGGGFFNLFGGLGPARGPWWKGPHVCVEREEIDESPKRRNDTKTHEADDQDGGDVFGSFEFSTCQQTATRYTCTTKTSRQGVHKAYVVRYQCCHGYARQHGEPDCTQVNLKTLLSTAEDLGAKDFVKIVTSHGLEKKLTDQNMTLFVPTDQAWRDFMEGMQQENQVEFFVPGSNARRRRSIQGTTLQELVAGHMARGLHDLHDISDEQVLHSENNNSTLRFNVYPNGVTTINCARFTNVNNYATNGIVHVVDRVVRPATRSVGELLEEDPRLATLKEMLDKAGLLDSLKQPGHVTLFAPTTAAFDLLPKVTRDRLQTEGPSCLNTVLRHHIVPHTLCSAAISGRMNTYSQAGDALHLQHGAEDGKLTIEGSDVITKDILATNGVIHVIDHVIVPESAKSVTEVLAANNLTGFASLLARAGLADSIDAMQNVTLLVPSNEALSVDKRADSLDKDQLRDVIMYHTAALEVQSCDLSNEQVLKTNLKDQDVRVNLYASQPLFMGVRNRATVQCARIISVDHKACGAVVHVVDRLMVPPSGDVMHLVDTDDRFSTLRDILKGTDLEKELRETSPITFLAPVNDAFQELKVSDLEKLKTDKKLASQVLRHHVLPEALCCSGVTANSWPFTRRVDTLSGDSLNMRRGPQGRVHLGTTTVTQCDVMATNGLLHGVDTIMLPRSMSTQGVGFKSALADRFGNPNLEVLLFGL